MAIGGFVEYTRASALSWPSYTRTPDSSITSNRRDK